MKDIYDINCDVFRRWITVSQMIPKGNWKVLDVGGNPNDEDIKLFFTSNIIVANPSYNEINGAKLPYTDNEFDFSISIDTLEHVPKENRSDFINELIRVSKYKVVLACPFDEPYVAEFENLIFNITKNKNLEEHVKFGLPNLHDTLLLIEEKEDCLYSVYNNDNLLSWVSFILLHQIVGNQVDLKEIKRLMNQIYLPTNDISLSYRKIIEIFKKITEQDLADFQSKLIKEEDKPATRQNNTITRQNDVSKIDINDLKVSIVIPTITIDLLDNCIKSIEENTKDINYEIIIVNDGSIEPALLDYLKNTKHKSISLEKNIGFGKANNVGFKEATGDFIMTLNADTVVRKDWLKNMLETILMSKTIAVVGPTILKFGSDMILTQGCILKKNSFDFDYIGKFLDYKSEKDKAFEVEAIGGACMLFRKDKLFEVGLFDENYINGCEDMDICLKLRNLGYKIFHAPAVIEHHEGFVRYKDPNAMQLIAKNKQYFIDKWFDMRKQKVNKSELFKIIDNSIDLNDKKILVCSNYESGIDGDVTFFNLQKDIGNWVSGGFNKVNYDVVILDDLESCGKEVIDLLKNISEISTTLVFSIQSLFGFFDLKKMVEEIGNITHFQSFVSLGSYEKNGKNTHVVVCER